jgi:hypothetical protein
MKRTITEAICEAARYFAGEKAFSPSHCDVRCLINDLTQENPRILRDGYNQNMAHKRVCNILKATALLQDQ